MPAEPVQMKVLNVPVQAGPGTTAAGDIAVGLTSRATIVIGLRHPDAQLHAQLTVDQLNAFADQLATIVDRIAAAEAGSTGTLQ